MSSSFSIPGNIKQQMLPFVLDPNAQLNITQNREGLMQKIGSQWFSFKKKNGIFPAGLGRIQICPSSLTDPRFGNYFNQDISYKLLYGNRDYVNTKKSITVDDVFETLPTIQIREFLPDTRLDQIINLLSDVFLAIKDVASGAIGGIDGILKALSNSSSIGKKFKLIFDMLGESFKFLVGQTKPNFLETIGKDGNLQPRFVDKNENFIYDNSDSWIDYKSRIIDFPYLMYYKLQSYVSTNVYELPANLSEKTVFSSDGSHGWKGGKGIGALQLTDGFLGKVPMLKSMIDDIIGNVQINWMPLWDPADGSAVEHPKVQIKFDLYNDTDRAAMMNFIFVNTLVPNNMYIQYGIFQHSSPLYDVRIAGFDRMFACSGNVSVQYQGPRRNPPRAWIEELVRKHANANASKENPVNTEKLLAAILENNLIRIPDVYQVTMDFTSLLPNNFNSYLFNYTRNIKMETTYRDSPPYQSAIVNTDALQSLKSDFVNYMTAWCEANQDGFAKIQQDAVYEKMRSDAIAKQQRAAAEANAKTKLANEGVIKNQ